MRQFFKNFWSKYKAEIIAAVGIILLYLTFFALGITCPIKFITGVSCPGCGMSRACLHAAKFDFKSAFYYHPMWITIPVFAFLLIFFKIKKIKIAFNITLCVFAVMMLCVYVYRLFFLSQSIVVFTPEEGVIPRIYRAIKGLF